MKTWKIWLLPQQETQQDWWHFQEIATFTFTFCGTIESKKTFTISLSCCSTIFLPQFAFEIFYLHPQALCDATLYVWHWWKNWKLTLWLHRIPVLDSTTIILFVLDAKFCNNIPKIFDHNISYILSHFVFWIVDLLMFWFSISTNLLYSIYLMKIQSWFLCYL